MKILLNLVALSALLFYLAGCCPPLCNVYYSPLAGIDLSNIGEDSDYGESDHDPLLGFRAGIDAFTPFNEQWTFGAGAHLARKGTKTNTTGEGDGYSYSYDNKTMLTYLDVPVVARYGIGETGLGVYGGFQPSLLLGAKTKTSGDGVPTSTNDVKDQFGSLDLAASLGVDYSFTNGIRLKLGYDHGLVNIADNDYYELRNRTFQFTVGYTLQKE